MILPLAHKAGQALSRCRSAHG